MIKAVLDTNVLISSLFWKGAPYKIIQKGLGGAFIILTSLEILEEVRNKLINKFKFPLKDTNEHFHDKEPCPNEFETTYSPDRPEIVYCEKCYLAEVV